MCGYYLDPRYRCPAPIAPRSRPRSYDDLHRRRKGYPLSLSQWGPQVNYSFRDPFKGDEHRVHGVAGATHVLVTALTPGRDGHADVESFHESFEEATSALAEWLARNPKAFGTERATVVEVTVGAGE